MAQMTRRLPYVPLPDPAAYYPRGPGWQGYESNPNAFVTAPRGRTTRGAVRRKANSYDAILGQSQVHTPIWSNWMPGLGNIWDDAKGVLNTVQEKGDQVEMALKAILVLSGIAAATGLYNAFRK